MTKTIKRAHSPGSGRHMSTKEKLELREQAAKQIIAMLEQKPVTPVDVAEALGLNKATAYSHLRYMAGNRQVRRSGKYDEHRRELWELGEDLTLPTKEEILDRDFEPKRPIVPACQVGMWRDCLVAAFFGTPEVQGSAA